LNACYSEIQTQAIAQHIRFVIGMNQAIGDKGAIAFSVGFYKALAANRSIEEAYKFGCVEIQLYNVPEHLKPVIYINPTAKPGVKKIIPNPFVPQNGRVEQPQEFFGRQLEIQRVFEVLNSGSSVALIGKDGIGKSSLLWEICRVAENRLQLSRQAVFFDLNDVGDEKDFYIALCDKVGIAECKGYKLTRNLRQRSQKVLLALDNVGKITCKGFSRNVRDQLRGLAEGGDAPLRLILAANEALEDLFNDSHNDGKTSPLAGICQEENIQPWEDAIMRDFIAARLMNTSVSFAEEEIIQLVQKVRDILGSDAAVLLNLSEICGGWAMNYTAFLVPRFYLGMTTKRLRLQYKKKEAEPLTMHPRRSQGTRRTRRTRGFQCVETHLSY
jgi:hypothetical protein